MSNNIFCKNCNGLLTPKYQEEINKKTGHCYYWKHIRKTDCINPEPKEVKRND